MRKDFLWWLASASGWVEGQILPDWLLCVRFVLFPVDSLFFLMSKSRGYQWNRDVWRIEGIDVSGGTFRTMAKTDGSLYRFSKNSGGFVVVERNPEMSDQQDGATQSSWRPIATAPKDGTEVLLWDGRRRIIGSWHQPAGPGGRFEWAGDSFASGEHNDWITIDSPTHWQSLDDPPENPTP